MINTKSFMLLLILFNMKYYGSFVLVTAAILKNGRRIFDDTDKNYIKLIGLLIPILLIIECLSLPGSPVVAQYGTKYFTRFMATILSKICIVCEAASIYTLCEQRTLKTLINTFIINGIVVILLGVAVKGSQEALNSVLSAFSITAREVGKNIFEVHESTFSIGLCILAIFYSGIKRPKMLIAFIILAVLFILGQKRIGIAAILVAFVFMFFVRKRGLSITTLLCAGIFGIVVCFAYITIIYDGRFFEIMSNEEINVMGRDAIYGYFTSRTELSPTYSGWGISSVSKFIEDMSRKEVGNMVAVRGIHNDILEIYIEAGFLGSLLWFGYQWLYVPLKLYNNMSKRTATLYMALIIYSFITYFTDNTEGYFVFQVTLFTLPLAVYKEYY